MADVTNVTKLQVQALPCPWCGSADLEMVDSNEGVLDAHFWWVACNDCHAWGPHFPSSIDALEEWNRGLGSR
jgi:Lar family restriction alleviation protein